MAVGGTAVIAALTAAGEGDHSRQQQRDGCPDDPWILEQSTHGGERAAGERARLFGPREEPILPRSSRADR